MEDELYKQYILELYHHPLNAGIIENPDYQSREINPTCGDELTLMANIKDGVISEIAHQSQGCAISQAAISLLTEEVKGMTFQESAKLSQDDMIALLGIPISHTRMKCALIGWSALQQMHIQEDKE